MPRMDLECKTYNLHHVLYNLWTFKEAMSLFQVSPPADKIRKVRYCNRFSVLTVSLLYHPSYREDDPTQEVTEGKVQKTSWGDTPFYCPGNGAKPQDTGQVWTKFTAIRVRGMRRKKEGVHQAGSWIQKRWCREGKAVFWSVRNFVGIKLAACPCWL